MGPKPNLTAGLTQSWDTVVGHAPTETEHERSGLEQAADTGQNDCTSWDRNARLEWGEMSQGGSRSMESDSRQG